MAQAPSTLGGGDRACMCNAMGIARRLITQQARRHSGNAKDSADSDANARNGVADGNVNGVADTPK